MKVLSNKETNMPHKTTAALAAVLFFGGASVVWADDNSQINGSFAQQ